MQTFVKPNFFSLKLLEIRATAGYNFLQSNRLHQKLVIYLEALSVSEKKSVNKNTL